MKNKFIKVMTIITLLSSLVFAPEISAKTEPYGAFYIEPHFPENQISESVGYYDLLMEPEMEQTISFDIMNQGDEVMIATIAFENGTTGINAVKTYTQDIEPDSSMKVPLTEMATIRTKEVELKPNEKETISIDIKAPKESFDGVNLGGITVIADYESDEDSKNEGSLEIRNRIAYLLAVQIRMNDNPIQQNLNYVKSTAELVDLKPQFISVIQNDQPVVMNNVTIEGSITSDQGDEVASVNVTEGGILPNTEFKVAYELNESKIESGEYKINLKISTDEDSWEWNEAVSLDEKEVEDLNEGTLVKDKNNILMYIIVLLLVLLIALVILLLFKKKRENK